MRSERYHAECKELSRSFKNFQQLCHEEEEEEGERRRRRRKRELTAASLPLPVMPRRRSRKELLCSK
jgi:hypothetical protein